MANVRLKFAKKALAKEMFRKAEAYQTELLVTYAENEIERIGDDISVAPTRNGLDRTGNLLDSLCWGVCKNGTLVKSGYYRTEEAFEDSHLHEYSNPMGEAVNGHAMAQTFLASYKPQVKKGWEVFFAVVAPYWGYWEQGFEHPSGMMFQWQVMTSHFDVVKRDLAPSRVTFHNYIPT